MRGYLENFAINCIGEVFFDILASKNIFLYFTIFLTMKKLLLLVFCSSFLTANAQCLAPTNFSIIEYSSNTVTLDWTENGTAIAWEIGAIPNYQIGNEAPTVPISVTVSRPYVVTGLPPGCIVFFVRSICIENGISDWTMVSSPACPELIFDFINSLSVNNFCTYSNLNLSLYPNPANNILTLETELEIEKVIISDISGKVITIQTSNSREVDVEKLSKGLYIIEVFSTQGKIIKKIIKKFLKE